MEKELAEINKLKKNADAIYTLYNIKLPQYKNYPSRYDKVGHGFNLDSRFAAHSPINIQFVSWMGTYGDSGCSSQITLDEDIFKDALVKYLNNNEEKIMLEVADIIMKKASKNKDAVKKYLQEQIENIESIGNTLKSSE